jgi:hypothetical protein
MILTISEEKWLNSCKLYPGKKIRNNMKYIYIYKKGKITNRYVPFPLLTATGEDSELDSHGISNELL